MIRDIANVHMTDDEVTNNFAAIVERIRKGVEVIVEQDHHPLALIRSPLPADRLLSECILLPEERGSTVTLDEAS
ncbi:MAG: hypothetical protein M3Y72_18640 [Acidobacteriota bacterium]|nr:hypothetical protein [Acidobacteriota bacterium]MDQ2843014.1 hypothetical protein [Acidobacteriota bacterium]